MGNEFKLISKSIIKVYGEEIYNWALSTCKFGNNEEENIKELYNQITNMCGKEALKKILKVRGALDVSIDLLVKLRDLQVSSTDLHSFINKINEANILNSNIEVFDDYLMVKNNKELSEINLDFQMGYLERIFEYIFQHEIYIHLENHNNLKIQLNTN